MKIALLQDFFAHEIIGGAEKNDSVLFNYLHASGYEIDCVHTYKVDDLLQKYDFFIVSNFIRLSDSAKEYMKEKKNYLIYEHDHKYLNNRNPGSFVDFKAPPTAIINKEFYNCAKKVFVLSKVCKETIEKNLNIDNVHNIACSLWSTETLDFIEKINKSSPKKTSEYAILDSKNFVKGTAPALAFCQKNEIVPTRIASPNYKEFITQLSECDKFIFFPQVLETYSRVCAEAKMLNCKVLTTPKLIGFFSEDYSKLSGAELNYKIRNNIKQALQKFEQVIFE